ncbi:sulfotransferase domain-containing protein [Nocardioides panacisoli]|uniref:sulfotransferase domain-containing protein n=1 Tax=Nocardioides panacisoli TaxID=627624 RepID=UPI001C62A0AE|nr:sulfotransferase domain-containing protein [Nocardioides panacisoli]QYJ02974.1 sulfotransferase domain-containing protein [Nocardioides panacisoli]
MSTTDPAAVRLLKRGLPRGAKDTVERGIRWGTTATAAFRPGPDFLVVGTKRGGTTTLWNALADHPQVQSMVPAAKHLKSPHFFSQYYVRGPAWYRGHFPTTVARRRHARAHGASLVGDACPTYLFDPRVPARAAELFPEVKVLISLRDPVERAYSHWKERVKEGTEDLDFAAALAAEPARLAGELDRMLADPDHDSRARDWFSYRSRGEYADQVAGWLAHFDRSQVLVVRAEDLYRDQPGVLGTVHDFLGLADHEGDPRWRNHMPSSPMAAEVRRDLEEHYAPHNRRLADVLGDPTWTDAWSAPATPTPEPLLGGAR